MATPPPTKPPRGVKYGKDEPSCGFLVNVIKSLGFSETNEERQREKQKIEKEFKKSDQRLNELVSKHDEDLTRVLPLFSQIASQVTISKEKIYNVKNNLIACKKLLECRRDELKKLWTDAIQQRMVLEMLEQINEIRKVPYLITTYTSKRDYLLATKILTQAIKLGDGLLSDVEGLNDLRVDLNNRKQQLYNKLIDELDQHLYKMTANEILINFQRQNSKRGSTKTHQEFQRNFIGRKSVDRAEAYARVRKALIEMTRNSGNNSNEKTTSTGTIITIDSSSNEIQIDEADLIDVEISRTYFIAVTVECFAMLNKVPESVETIKVQIQSELLKIITLTTQQMIALDLFQQQQQHNHPLLCLLDVIFKQFKSVAQTHSLLLKNYLNVQQRYNVNATLYDLTDFWTQAQAVLQLLLTDYLDIQNASAEEGSQTTTFTEPTRDINAYFRRKKGQSKKMLFKFDRAAHIVDQENSFIKEHRRNASDISNDENLHLTGSSGNLSNGKKREKVLVCEPDSSLIRIIYLPLMSYVHEIEIFMKCKSGQPCSLSAFISNYIKDTFLPKGHRRNLELTIESLSKNQDAWRAITTPEEMRQLNLHRPLLQSTVLVEKRIAETRSLIQDLPHYCEELLTMVCKLLKTYRETCQAAYRGIVQPDAEDKRIYSVAWLKDEDISRFLKTLPNWTDLKTSSKRAKTGGKKLQRSNYEPSEEESPTQVQQRNIREAEMLTSNLGEGGISHQEILGDISILKELAILQESMEWFSSRISEFANDLRRPILNGLNTNSNSEYTTSITISDGTIKVLTNLALEFDELANICLLVLHLEVRVQCFHYLRSTDKLNERTNDYLVNKDDILEPDPQVLKLTKVLSEMDEAFCATLHPRKTKYIFEGLAHLASRILIQASNYMENIDQISIQRMCRNAIALQQTLSSITASREVALDQAKNFYELLCMSPDEILTTIVEKGGQFTEMQYLNALQISSKVRGITDSNCLAAYQQKLSDILGAKPSKGVVV